MSAITKSVDNSANRAEISSWDDCLRLLSCLVIFGAVFSLAYIFVRMNAERETTETTVRALAVKSLLLVAVMSLLCGLGAITSVGVMPVDNAIIVERLSAKIVEILATTITAIATALTTNTLMFAQSFGELLSAFGSVMKCAVIAVWTEVSLQKFMNLVVMGIFLTVFPETFEYFRRMMAEPPK
jgi:magnesium-transporting ATPase (P-type)